MRFSFCWRGRPKCWDNSQPFPGIRSSRSHTFRPPLRNRCDVPDLTPPPRMARPLTNRPPTINPRPTPAPTSITAKSSTPRPAEAVVPFREAQRVTSCRATCTRYRATTREVSRGRAWPIGHFGHVRRQHPAKPCGNPPTPAGPDPAPDVVMPGFAIVFPNGHTGSASSNSETSRVSASESSACRRATRHQARPTRVRNARRRWRCRDTWVEDVASRRLGCGSTATGSGASASSDKTQPSATTQPLSTRWVRSAPFDGPLPHATSVRKSGESRSTCRSFQLPDDRRSNGRDGGRRSRNSWRHER